MEMVTKFLLPYQDLIAYFTGIATFSQYLAGIDICVDIGRRESTKGFSSMPFIGGIAMGILFIQYGFMTSDPAMILVYLVTVISNILYIVFFLIRSEDKNNEVFKPMAYAAAVVAILLAYIRSDTSKYVVLKFGLILHVLMGSFVGWPLLEVQEIVTKRNTSIIPFPVTFTTAVVSFFWVLYGLTLPNAFMIIQNAIGFFLCTIQLVLFFIYRP